MATCWRAIAAAFDGAFGGTFGGAADSSAEAVDKAREATRQMVPIIAELRVRTFTVTLLKAAHGEFTRLLGRVVRGGRGRPRQHATWVGGWCATGRGRDYWDGRVLA